MSVGTVQNMYMQSKRGSFSIIIEGSGHNQSMLNFGLFFLFAQICLIFGM